MKYRIFFLITCAMLALTTLASAQKQYGGAYNPFHNYTPGEWYTPEKSEDKCGCKPGFYPVNNIVSPTQFGCIIVKCVKAGKPTPKKQTDKGGGVTPPPPVPPSVYNSSSTTIDDRDYNDNRSYLTIYEQPSKLNLRGVARTRWVAEGTLLLPTDRSFKAVVPELKLGYEIEGHFENAPGLRLNFQGTAIFSNGEQEETCPSCVPQTVRIFNVGGNARTSLDWYVTKKMILRGYFQTNVWIPLNREVKPGPDQGWGAELEFGKGPVKFFTGGVKSYTKNFSGYVGVKAEAFEKYNGRKLYNPSDKLTSEGAEARAKRHEERLAKQDSIARVRAAEVRKQDSSDLVIYLWLTPNPILIDTLALQLDTTYQDKTPQKVGFIKVPVLPFSNQVKVTKLNKAKTDVLDLSIEHNKLKTEAKAGDFTKGPALKTNIKQLKVAKKKLEKLQRQKQKHDERKLAKVKNQSK